ncbi:hypothetical protein EC973_009629, partial [Apophysomyces ossiformis]
QPEFLADLHTVYKEYEKLRTGQADKPLVDISGDMMHCFTSTCGQMAVAASNHIVENYSQRMEKYIKYCLHIELASRTPVNVFRLTHFMQTQEKLKIEIITEDVKKLAKFAYDIGAKGQSHYPYSVVPRDEFKTAINTVNTCTENVPVTSTELAAKPHVYIRPLYEILKDLEPSGDTPVRKPMLIPSRG